MTLVKDATMRLYTNILQQYKLTVKQQERLNNTDILTDFGLKISLVTRRHILKQSLEQIGNALSGRQTHTHELSKLIALHKKQIAKLYPKKRLQNYNYFNKLMVVLHTLNQSSAIL